MVARVRVWLVLGSGLVVLCGCGGGSSTKSRSASLRQGGNAGQLIAVGEPTSARPVAVSGSTGTLELRVARPGQSPRSSLLATLVRPVAREPRDVCFGLYTADQDPIDGDVVCGVRRPDGLVTSLGQMVVPGVPGETTYVLTQAPADVTQVKLTGAAGSHPLPLSEHRVSLAVLSPSARGTVQLRAAFSNGRRFTGTFTLPLTAKQLAGALRYRRAGAVFNDEVGESILTESYQQIVRRFGAPLATISATHGTRCVYYDEVGELKGWEFCFKRDKMVGAGGDQPPPAGVR